MTRTAWRLGVLLFCLLVPAARAQDGMLGLPLVLRDGGWARYVGNTPEGSTTFVFKVGAHGTYEGQRGRWLLLEIEVPGTGHVLFEFLVKGKVFTADQVLHTRVSVPGKAPQETKDAFANPERPGAWRPRFLRETTAKVAGREFPVTEYSFPAGLTAAWSPEVPGVGLVEVTGPEPFQLVAFGVGGDPWKGTTGRAHWPTPPATK